MNEYTNEPRFLDIALFTDGGYESADSETKKKFPPLKKYISISTDLWISPISKNVSKAIMSACEARGFNLDDISRMFKQLYAIGREAPPLRDNFMTWDSDERIQLCIALSRIIHPTSINFEYSARLKFDEKDNIIEIIPGATASFGSSAFISDISRDWLTQNEGSELKEIFEAYEIKPLQEPFKRALWYFEYASRIYEVEVRFALICTGIESLLHVGKLQSTEQFKVRLQKLANLCNEIEITKAEALQMYNYRSTLVHGQKLKDLSTDSMILYSKMENVLRLAIKRAIFDKDFSDFFIDRIRLQKEWPVKGDKF